MDGPPAGCPSQDAMQNRVPPENHNPARQPYRVEAQRLVSTTDITNHHVGGGHRDGGAIGRESFSGRCTKSGLPPEPPRHPRLLQCIGINSMRVRIRRPRRGIRRLCVWIELPRHRRGPKRKRIPTCAAALPSHQEANGHLLSWCMCVPHGPTELIPPF